MAGLGRWRRSTLEHLRNGNTWKNTLMVLHDQQYGYHRSCQRRNGFPLPSHDSSSHALIILVVVQMFTQIPCPTVAYLAGLYTAVGTATNVRSQTIFFHLKKRLVDWTVPPIRVRTCGEPVSGITELPRWHAALTPDETNVYRSIKIVGYGRSGYIFKAALATVGGASLTRLCVAIDKWRSSHDGSSATVHARSQRNT